MTGSSVVVAVHMRSPRPQLLGARAPCAAPLAAALSVLWLLAAAPALAVRHGGHAAHLVRSPAASRYPPSVSRPRDHGGAAPLASSAAAKKPAAKKPKKPVLTGNPARALLAFEAMQRYYYVRGSGLYKGEPFSYLWPFSQALAATVSMSDVPKTGVSFAQEL
ncbi:MAG TPA: hypothetical protein VGH21_04985, partial [Solirubrobacteraceae bacterium]